MARLSSQAQDSLKQRIDQVTAAETDNIPGAVFCAVNKNGDFIFQHASGRRGLGSSSPPESTTLDSVFWIASCTKMITGIACMQLVERGELNLDDVEQVEKLAPELKEIKVLTDDDDDDGKKELVEKERGISLRMLLNHTAGFSYSFFSKKLNDYFLPAGLDEFSGMQEDFLSQPLIYQPGSRYEYGISIDWAGILVERVSGMKLGEYFDKYIFKPMCIKDIKFQPTAEMRARLMFMHERGGDGKVTLREDGHLVRRVLKDLGKADEERTFHSGGGGCFGTVPEYCQIIAMLLNDGRHPGSGAQILKPDTVNEMFHNSLPSSMHGFGRQGIYTSKPHLSNDIPDQYGLDPAPNPQGWGLTFFVHLNDVPATGRAANTAWWTGLANLYWWCDRKSGIGGMVGTQILPFGDAKVIGLWAEIEKGIYDSLGQ